MSEAVVVPRSGERLRYYRADARTSSLMISVGFILNSSACGGRLRLQVSRWRFHADLTQGAKDMLSNVPERRENSPLDPMRSHLPLRKRELGLRTHTSEIFVTPH